ncbi:MAG: hypothetical protein EHM31_10355 [Candidatus Aminicenantes bacterium]|nr:MAG: hypothetical protein EHM31_10355 [Candidatus Aminicenantes bacterium]
MDQDGSGLPFGKGFLVVRRPKGDGHALHIRKPVMSLSERGYAIFNNGATQLLMGENMEFQAVRLAFNPVTNVLAIKPEREHLGYPETVKISLAGGYRRAGLISFKGLAAYFNINLTNAKYHLVWNGETGVAEVDLNDPIKLEPPPV